MPTILLMLVERSEEEFLEDLLDQVLFFHNFGTCFFVNIAENLLGEIDQADKQPLLLYLLLKAFELIDFLLRFFHDALLFLAVFFLDRLDLLDDLGEQLDRVIDLALVFCLTRLSIQGDQFVEQLEELSGRIVRDLLEIARHEAEKEDQCAVVASAEMDTQRRERVLEGLSYLLLWASEKSAQNEVVDVLDSRSLVTVLPSHEFFEDVWLVKDAARPEGQAILNNDLILEGKAAPLNGLRD